MKSMAIAETVQEQPTLEALAASISEISSLPHIAAKTIEIANDPNSTTLDLKNVIETDAALTARILRCVNSSAYALRQHISNLMHAISYLGTREVRRLAVTASVAELVRHDEEIGAYRRSSLWRHLVAVGLCARLLALRQKMPDFEDAFLAGLLHDIGIILEDQYAHQGFRAVVSALDSHTPLIETERSVLGFDHCQLGARLAGVWRFPEHVRAAIAHHHDSSDYRGPALPIVHCVEVANAVCTVKNLTSVGWKLVQAPGLALRALALTREQLTVLADDVDKELANNAALMEL